MFSILISFQEAQRAYKVNKFSVNGSKIDAIGAHRNYFAGITKDNDSAILAATAPLDYPFSRE